MFFIFFWIFTIFFGLLFYQGELDIHVRGDDDKEEVGCVTYFARKKETQPHVNTTLLFVRKRRRYTSGASYLYP